jgi:hypothetical protein
MREVAQRMHQLELNLAEQIRRVQEAARTEPAAARALHAGPNRDATTVRASTLEAAAGDMMNVDNL